MALKEEEEGDDGGADNEEEEKKKKIKNQSDNMECSEHKYTGPVSYILVIITKKLMRISRREELPRIIARNQDLENADQCA